MTQPTHAVYPDNEGKWEYEEKEAVFKGTEKECKQWVMNNGRVLYNILPINN